jgi:hypothetical protein
MKKPTADFLSISLLLFAGVLTAWMGVAGPLLEPSWSMATVRGEVWAAWVQAIGSIAAIFVAIAVSRHQSSVARALAQDDLERRGHVVAAYASVQQINLRNEVKSIRRIINYREANLTIIGKGVEAALDGLLFSATEADAFILQNAAALPKEARLAFPQLMAVKQLYNAKMLKLYTSIAAGGHRGLADVNNTANPLLDAIERLIDEIRASAGSFNDRAVLETRIPGSER